MSLKTPGVHIFFLTQSNLPIMGVNWILVKVLQDEIESIYIFKQGDSHEREAITCPSCQECQLTG